MDIMESQQIAISIHTSTREVTARDRGRFGAVIYFNPHFHKGSDCTHHQTPDTMLYFNPHFHKGSDLTIYAQHDFKLISIHTSTREVTLGDYCDMYNGDNFNPHFHKGSDRRLYLTSLICINFNPHFHKGSDGMAGT